MTHAIINIINQAMVARTDLELMRARALSAWVSHRSVRTSISLLSCNHSSRLGLPTKPTHRGEAQAWWSVFVSKQGGHEPSQLQCIKDLIYWDVAKPYFDSRTVCSPWLDDSHTTSVAKTSDTWLPDALKQPAVISGAHVSIFNYNLWLIIPVDKQTCLLTFSLFSTSWFN